MSDFSTYKKLKVKLPTRQRKFIHLCLQLYSTSCTSVEEFVKMNWLSIVKWSEQCISSNLYKFAYPLALSARHTLKNQKQPNKDKNIVIQIQTILKKNKEGLKCVIYLHLSVEKAILENVEAIQSFDTSKGNSQFMFV